VTLFEWWKQSGWRVLLRNWFGPRILVEDVIKDEGKEADLVCRITRGAGVIKDTYTTAYETYRTEVGDPNPFPSPETLPDV
jgi:hypothetical protein